MSSDVKIIRKLKNKSSDAFKKVYYEYKNLIFYHAFSIVNNREDAEDITQNTFIKFMRNIDSIDDDSSLKSLLSKIAKNEAIDVYRKKANRKEILNDDLIENSSKSTNENDDFNVLITLNNSLEVLDAKIVSLRIVYDYSFSEISEELDLSIGVVQAKYYKALDILKKHYQGRA